MRDRRREGEARRRKEREEQGVRDEGFKELHNVDRKKYIYIYCSMIRVSSMFFCFYRYIQCYVFLDAFVR